MSGYQRTYQSSYSSQRVTTEHAQKELNVPGYETRVRYRNDLGKRQDQQLDIACFLMAVEVERLIRENTQLKSEIQSFIDSGLDRVNYEMQIRDLMEKLKNQSSDINGYQEDHERLVVIIRELEEEIKRLEEQLKDYDPNWRKSQRDLELQLQIQTKLFGGKGPQEIQKELDELRKKAKLLDDLQKKVGGKNPEDLLKELDNLKKKAQQFDEINSKLNGKNFADLERELAKLKQKADQFDEISKQFSNPSTVQIQLDDIQKELEQLRKKAGELDKIKQSLNNQNPDQLLKGLEENKKQLTSKDKEIADLNRALREFQSNQQQFDDQMRLMQLKIDELEEKVVGLAQELHRYKFLLKGKEDEVAKFQMLIRDNENKLSMLNNELTRSKTDLQKAQGDLTKAKGDLQKAQTDLTKTQQESAKLKKQAEELERQNQELQEDNLNLQNDIENHTQNLGQLDDLKDEMNDLKDEKSKLNNQVYDLEKNLKDKEQQFAQQSRELQDALDRVKQLEAKLLEMDNYIDTLEEDLQRFEQDNQKLHVQAGQKTQADRELDRLRGILEQMKNQNDAQQKELGQLKGNLDQLRDLQDALSMAKADLDKANHLIAAQQDELAQKENDIQQLVKEVQNLEEANHELKDQNQSLQETVTSQQLVQSGNQEELTKLRRIADDYKDKIRQLESKYNEFATLEDRLKQSDHRIAVLMTEIERLNAVVKQQTQETEDWKQKHARIELALLEFRQIEKTNRDAAGKNQQFINEIERLKKLLEAKHIELLQTFERCDLLESQQQTLMNQVQDALKKADTGDNILLQYLLIAAENDRLNQVLQPMQEKYTQMKTQFTEINTKFTEMQTRTLGVDIDEYERLKKMIIEYENKIAMLSLEVQRLKAKTNLQDGNNNGYGSSQQQIRYNNNLIFSSQEDLQNKITDLLCLIAMMSAELDVLRTNNEKQVQQQMTNYIRNETTTQVQQVESTSGFSYQRVQSNRRY